MNRLVVIDNFYSNPDSVRKQAYGMQYVEPEDLTGWRTNRGFLPRTFASRLRRLSGLRKVNVERPHGTPHDNGVFYLALSQGRKRELPKVHYDEPLSHLICLVYLTPDLPADCGTSFFRHRSTELECAPTPRDVSRLGLSRRDLIEILESDSGRRHRWIEVDRVGYRYNRAVIYPARRLHAATRHFGGSVKDGRIYQLFSFRGT